MTQQTTNETTASRNAREGTYTAKIRGDHFRGASARHKEVKRTRRDRKAEQRAARAWINYDGEY